MEDRGRVFLVYSCLQVSPTLQYSSILSFLFSATARTLVRPNNFFPVWVLHRSQRRGGDKAKREREKKSHFSLLLLKVLNKFCLCMRST